MKILAAGVVGFIGYHLAKKLLEHGNEVVGLDSINDYYGVNLKYGRLRELGIEKDYVGDREFSIWTTCLRHQFIKLDLSNSGEIENLFKEEKFDTIMYLAAQAGVRRSIENPYNVHRE